ncbi:polysaccharide deacetylase family protein [Ornithinibacillus sp. FSL M8-0202]|uniref:polysaccharide deacetylase family protein n=1 Tax=Ornithinibacillus sp. FSL M8-0202 TaxID=2921616 RepID=UPI0030CA9097
MRQKLVYFVLPIMLIVGIVLFFVFSSNDSDSDTSEKQGAKETETEQPAYPGVNIITEVLEEEAYHLAIHYPEFEDKQLNKIMNDYVSKSKQEFLQEVEDTEELSQGHNASFYLSFDIYPVVENVYSIVFTKESYFGGANSMQISKIFITDIENNQFIDQSNIIKDTGESREEIYQKLLHAFKINEAYSPFFFEEELQKWIDDENNTFSNVYLTDESIVFKFDKYEVTAGAAGTPEIAIPLVEMQDLLTDEWKERLDVPNQTAEDSEPAKPNEEQGLEQEVPAGKKRVALTFDDGPHPSNTQEILKLLDEHQAKATFFMLGNRAVFYPDIVKEVAAKGHEIGNHTWSHKDLTTLSNEEIREEFQQTNDAILSVLGVSPTAFRPPYGAINDQVTDVIGIPSTLWTIDTLDWKSHDPDQVLSIVKENVQDGSIILMHDIHATTVEAVELVLDFLEAEGYAFVTVSDIN